MWARPLISDASMIIMVSGKDGREGIPGQTWLEPIHHRREVSTSGWTDSRMSMVIPMGEQTLQPQLKTVKSEVSEGGDIRAGYHVAGEG